MVEELIGMAGLTMNDGTIVAHCTRLSEKLYAHVNDSLTLTTANMTVKRTFDNSTSDPIERQQTETQSIISTWQAQDHSTGDQCKFT